MATPNWVHQYQANRYADLVKFLALYTGAGGTTGANEATGSPYARAALGAYTPDGVGDVTWSQTNMPCPAGEYEEAGFLSTPTGTLLSIPSGLTIAPGSGGSLTAGVARFYVLTAFNAAGETTVSAEVSITPSGGSLKAVLGFSAVTGVTGLSAVASLFAGYRLYVGTTSGGENILLATLPSTALAYTDDGTVPGASATPPTTNTASTFNGSNEFQGGTIEAIGGSASINVAPSATS